MLLQNALAAPLRRDGIIDLYELCGEDETQMNRNERIRIDNLKACFPRHMMELAGAFDPDDNIETLLYGLADRPLLVKCYDCCKH